MFHRRNINFEKPNLESFFVRNC